MAIAASVIAKQIRGQLVIKDGASTGITTGKIIDVTAGVVLVKGNEQTPFSAPGDSGAVVRMKDSDDVVGIVLSITFEEVFGYYTTSAQPIWTFYSTACDAAECAADAYSSRDPAGIDTVSAICEDLKTDTEVNRKTAVIQTKYDTAEGCTATATDDKMMSPSVSHVSSCVLS